MADAITIKALQDASLDAKSLEEVVNGGEEKQVTTRKGETYPSVKKAIKTMFQNGGLPATPFATKALMAASALVDGDYAMVTDDTANDGLYVKTAGTWVKSGYDPLAKSISYTEKLTSEVKNDIVSISHNLFDYTKAELNASVRDDGSVQSSSTYSVSDFIPVEGGQTYSITGVSGENAFLNIAYFDDEKKFITRIDTGNATSGVKSHLIPENAAYVRLNMRGKPSENDRVFFKGTVAQPYEGFYRKLKDYSLSDKTMNEVVAVTGRVSDYIEPSLNLFNHETSTLNRYIEDTGEVRYSPLSSVSDFIPVQGSAVYNITSSPGVSAFTQIVYYTADKEYMYKEQAGNASMITRVIITPKDAAYVRFNLQRHPSDNERMFSKGDTKQPYEEFGDRLKNVVVKGEVLKQIQDDSRSNIVFDMPITGVFQTNQVWTEYLDMRTRSSSSVYDMYDALAAQHPEYITKIPLGADDFGNQIAYYKFSPARNESNAIIKFPKIYLNAGIHGHEKLPVLSAYLTLEQICNNWESDPLLEVMRFNVDFIVLPLTNPSGWDLNTRKNGNGVDLNRNFPEQWVLEENPDSITYGGPSPASEKETQYMMQIIEDNNGIDAFYDYHSFDNPDKNIWVAGDVGNAYRTEGMARALISRMTRLWRKEYEWIPRDPIWFVGYSTGLMSTASGSTKKYAYSKGVPLTATFEIGEKWQLKGHGTSSYDDVHCKTAMETLTNWILINLAEIQRG